MKQSEMASLSNSRWCVCVLIISKKQNRKERQNRITNNGDMAETVKRPVRE